jgi:hypothetical protein
VDYDYGWSSTQVGGPEMKEMDRHYSWKTAKCVRYGEDFSEESHPCYWCGVPQKIVWEGVKWCEKCGGFECSSCGKCWCNVEGDKLGVLQKLRDKYCCNWLNFKKGVLLGVDLAMVRIYVPGFKAALDYCRARKGFSEAQAKD